MNPRKGILDNKGTANYDRGETEPRYPDASTPRCWDWGHIHSHSLQKLYFEFQIFQGSVASSEHEVKFSVTGT